MAAYTEEEITQILKTIPENLLGLYVQKIKDVNREYRNELAIFLPEEENFFILMNESGLFVEDEEDKKLDQQYWQASRESNFDQMKAAYGQQQAKLAKRHAEFLRQYPEYAEHEERRSNIGVKYTSGEAELKVSFCLSGGSKEQFDALRQAVLARRFSSKRPESSIPLPEFTKSEPT